MGRAVLGRGPPPPPLLLPAQRLVGFALGSVLTLRRLVRGAAGRLEAVEHRLRVGLSPGEVPLSLVRAQHHFYSLVLAVAPPEEPVARTETIKTLIPAPL